MEHADLLDLSEVVKQIFASKDIIELNNAKADVRKIAHAYLKGKLNCESLPADYLPWIFDVYGRSFVKKIFLREDMLRGALSLNNEAAATEAYKELYYYLRDIHPSEDETHKHISILRTKQGKLGNLVTEIIAPGTTFLQRIRFQAYSRTWKLMEKSIQRNKNEDHTELADMLLQYIRGVHKVTKHTGNGTLNGAAAWSLFRPNIRLVLESEISFMKTLEHNHPYPMAVTLSKITHYTRKLSLQELYRDRFRIMISGIIRGKVPEYRAVELVDNFLQHFNFLPAPTEKDVLAKKIAWLYQQPHKEDRKHLYTLVDTMIRELE